MRANRLRLLAPGLAIALAIAAGCQPAPPPEAPGPHATASPAVTPLPSATPSTQTSEIVAVASPTAPADTPLPAASADSNLDSTDQSAVEDVLNSDEVAQYLPDDLIHDGGVILFRTLSMPDAAANGGASGSGAAGTAPLSPPAIWARQNIEHGGRQDKLRLAKDPATGERLVNATLRYVMRGELAYRPSQGRAVRKRFAEVFERDLRLRLKNNRWRLDSFSPIQITSLPLDNGPAIDSVKLYPAGGTLPLESLTGTDHWLAPGDEPAIAPGSSVRVEVQAHNRDGGSVFVFADLVGASDRNREQLYDDGTHGDLTANDGTYTAVFAVPETEGLRHFAIDVIDPVSFAPGGLYGSLAWGLSVRVTNTP